jgi:hypothetical protein
LTKREVLLAICENPGWHPPAMVNGSHMDAMLTQLKREGWILPRLDGYEATPQALNEYPHFTSQVDLLDPDACAYERPVEPKGWYDVHCPDTMVLASGQRMDMAIEHAYLVKGGVTLEATGAMYKRVEIEVILRVRELPVNDKEGE